MLSRDYHMSFSDQEVASVTEKFHWMMLLDTLKSTELYRTSDDFKKLASIFFPKIGQPHVTTQTADCSFLVAFCKKTTICSYTKVIKRPSSSDLLWIFTQIIRNRLIQGGFHLEMLAVRIPFTANKVQIIGGMLSSLKDIDFFFFLVD